MHQSIVTADANQVKHRISAFYDRLTPHFRDLWGPHLHDGYYGRGATSKEMAQDHLVDVLADAVGVVEGASVLDVGCGMGATSVCLSKRWRCRTHGITLSPVQVDIAQDLARREGVADRATFAVGDAETLRLDRRFDLLWMVGVLAHLPNQAGFVGRSRSFLRPGGRFLLGDWMLGTGVSERDRARLVDPVLEGMLMPSIFTLLTTAGWFEKAGYRVVETRDITKQTAPTWDEGVSITQTGSVLRLAQCLGLDALRLVQAVHAMRKAMAEGAVVYGVVVAEAS